MLSIFIKQGRYNVGGERAMKPSTSAAKSEVHRSEYSKLVSEKDLPPPPPPPPKKKREIHVKCMTGIACVCTLFPSCFPICCTSIFLDLCFSWESGVVIWINAMAKCFLARKWEPLLSSTFHSVMLHCWTFTLFCGLNSCLHWNCASGKQSIYSCHFNTCETSG